MDSKTTVTQGPPSPEESAYLQSQADLAQKQLEILGSQQDFNQSYLDQIKPILDQTLQLQQQQLAAANDPTQLAITKLTAQQQLQALQDNADLAPLQKQVLQKQLQDVLQGPNATPEQAAQIDAATQAAQDKGTSDISDFQDTAEQALRTNLSPSLGLRPTDTPIVDRGQLVAKEAVRQQGQLTSNLAQANAEAKLNYPLSAGQLEGAQSQFAGSLTEAANQFQAGLADAANTNRLRLLSSASDMINSGTQTGIGLVTGSKGNPLSFTRDQTTSKSMGFGDLLGAAGGIMSGLGALGLSDARAKTDIRTEGYDDAGHRWVSFKYKGDKSRTDHVGVIAQEAEKISPDAVLTDSRGVKYVAYNRLSKRRAA